MTRYRKVAIAVGVFALFVVIAKTGEVQPTAAVPVATASPYSAECAKAFAAAAAVDAMRDRNEDMDPAFGACVTFAEFVAASAAYPDALDGADERTWVRNRCEYSANPQVRSSALCQEVRP